MFCEIATASASVGVGAVTASAGDFPVGSARPQIFDVAGQSYMAYLQETAGAKISLAPVEL